jgi:alpha-1,2-mannosyltransferase
VVTALAQRSPARTTRWTLAVLTALFMGVALSGRTLLDLEVYRLGGRTWLAGLDLYSPGFPAPFTGPDLPFTYPPAAAIAFAPLALVPLGVATVLMTTASVLALVVVVRVALQTAGRDVPLPAVVALVVAACLVLEPVRSTLAFGQVNSGLMVLVVVDCLVLPARYRGYLVGVAAAIKLVPLGFLLFFLAGGDRRGVVRCLAGFAATSLGAVVLAPTDSWHYWTSVVLDAGRIGTPEWMTNQSVTGALARTSLSPETAAIVRGVALTLLAGCALVGARHLLGRDRRLAALVVVAAWCLLASPVSWSHHWVWAVPALVAVADARWATTRRVRLLVGGAGALVVALAPLLWGRGLGQVVDDAYAWAAVLLVVGSAVAAVRARSFTGRRSAGPGW